MGASLFQESEETSMNRRVVSRFVIAVVGVVSCARLLADEPVTAVRVRTDVARREIVVTVGPIEIPAATSYSHHPPEARLQFQWPAAGWLRGYRIDLLDAEGRLLPRDMIHHAGVVNLERRQLAYPLVERLVAAGRETRPVMLPESMGVPLVSGQKLLMYYALVNPTDKVLNGATLELTVTWTPESTKTPTSAFPVYLDANPKPAGGTRSFDVPAGISVTSAEFKLPIAGRLRALGAHLHDYAVEMRLEDVLTGKVMARIKTRRQADGRLISVNMTRFLLKRGGLRLLANHPYRVVAVYDNPTGQTSPDGAMAFLVGPFIPDDVKLWPTVDSNDKVFQEDLAVLLGRSVHTGHGHGHR
jgi:hypothetical protein